MLAPNGRDYNRVADRDRFVCEWHIGQGADTQDWCSAPAPWGAPRVGDTYRDGALNYLCETHLQELMDGGRPPGADMATRPTPPAEGAARNDRINVDDFRPSPSGAYLCEFVVPRPGHERNWCNATARWRNTSSTLAAE